MWRPLSTLILISWMQKNDHAIKWNNFKTRFRSDKKEINGTTALKWKSTLWCFSSRFSLALLFFSPFSCEEIFWALTHLCWKKQAGAHQARKLQRVKSHMNDWLNSCFVSFIWGPKAKVLMLLKIWCRKGPYTLDELIGHHNGSNVALAPPA